MAQDALRQHSKVCTEATTALNQAHVQSFSSFVTAVESSMVATDRQNERSL